MAAWEVIYVTLLQWLGWKQMGNQRKSVNSVISY